MTIPRFLKTTALTKAEVAEKCGVDVSQVYRWKAGSSTPSGAPLMQLIALSGGAIRLKDVPVVKRGPKPKAA